VGFLRIEISFSFSAFTLSASDGPPLLFLRKESWNFMKKRGISGCCPGLDPCLDKKSKPWFSSAVVKIAHFRPAFTCISEDYYYDEFVTHKLENVVCEDVEPKEDVSKKHA
jgi:hypothetical protein